MAYNENPHAENLHDKDSEYIDEEIRRRRKSWLRSHMTAIYIAAGILIAALVFIGIKLYNDSTNPVTRFVSASGKNLGTSFAFHLTAEKNGEVMMSYDGTMKVDPSAHKVTAVLDAAYKSYSYTNVVFTEGSKSYRGNLYQNRWVVTDCTDRVNEFFDFYTDYKKGDFDGGSFLRFTKLNGYLKAKEFNQLMRTLRSRLSSDSAVAKITTSRSDSNTCYHYDISLKDLFELIRAQGAPAFFSSAVYNSLIARIDANVGNIEKASCSVDFTINGSGYLSELGFSIGTGQNTYTVHAVMDQFGSAEPVIPDDFYEAVGLQKD